MIVNLYAVFDSVSEEFGQPFCCKNDKLALKGFKKFLEGKNFEEDDLSLFYIGSYNTDSGALSGDTILKISDEDIKNE